MSLFLDYLDTLAPLDQRTKALVESAVKVSVVKKKEFLHKAGTVCRKFHFVESGILRVYYYKDGKEVTAWFAFEGMTASCIDSLFTGAETSYYIDVVEDAKIHTVHYDIIERSFVDYPLLERLGRLMVTENYLLLDQRMKMMVFHSAEERYKNLLGDEPLALQKIPLNYLASYLNVTQETLSRIRGKK
ncbi:Crp/Fnr family transcriptional regulator [Dyadobacter arcticus]|uniref:CRP-like cAMP-binding protein n=1 Tax=Dyadobacter arcticus TaxID=1078754 RepID=A0ABX0UGT0_9BACT|nr:Crp/Fnr family transcriptional regulator [Dyadobacter arcticus]NIJ52219.1 CRP-like cAMP-binding protein [Dyadobacter arcticus]